MNDAQELVFSHDMKANGITRLRVNGGMDVNSSNRGVLYHLEGPVATPIQFFMTDSAEHFLRGSLYYDFKPNPDSTAPVTRRLVRDIEHFMSTVSWE